MAFDLCSAGERPDLTARVHLLKGQFLEDQGQFQAAEREFIAANKPNEALLMYIHEGMLDAAQKVADAYCTGKQHFFTFNRSKLILKTVFFLICKEKTHKVYNYDREKHNQLIEISDKVYRTEIERKKKFFLFMNNKCTGNFHHPKTQQRL